MAASRGIPLDDHSRDPAATSPVLRAQVTELALSVEHLLRANPDPRAAAFLDDWPDLQSTGTLSGDDGLPVVRWLAGWPERIDCRIIAHEVARLSHRLQWAHTYKKEDFGPAFLENYGWTELIGLRGPIRHEALACGFLLLGPATEYPMHRHVAEEIYIPISGTAAWRAGEGDWSLKRPGEVIFHASLVPHAMRTDAEPLLALYLWHKGDLREKSQIG